MISIESKISDLILRKCECESPKITKQDKNELSEDDNLSIVEENNDNNDIAQSDIRNAQANIVRIQGTDEDKNICSISDDISIDNESNVFI